MRAGPNAALARVDLMGRIGRVGQIVAASAVAIIATLGSVLAAGMLAGSPTASAPEATAEVDAPVSFRVDRPPPELQPAPAVEDTAQRSFEPPLARPQLERDRSRTNPMSASSAAHRDHPTGELPSAAMGGLPTASGLPSSGAASGGPGGTTDSTRRPAQAVHRPPPTYPAVARRQGVEGHVTLMLEIDARGRVRDAEVLDADPPGVFETSALRTVRTYRFTPAVENGAPTTTRLRQTIRFELER